MTRATQERGVTLVEMLAVIAIAATLVLPLAAVVNEAVSAHAVSSDAIDGTQQATFAMQRVIAQVRSTVPHELAAKALTTSGDWLAPVVFCLGAGGRLAETTLDDAACAGGRPIADGVTVFEVREYTAGPNAAPALDIVLTVAGQSSQTVSLTARVRLGGGTL